MFYLSNRSGMRLGEVCGLRMGDLEFLREGAIRVAHSYGGPLKEDKRSEGKLKWVPAANRRREDAEGPSQAPQARGREGRRPRIRSAEATSPEANVRVGRLPQGTRARYVGEGAPDRGPVSDLVPGHTSHRRLACAEGRCSTSTRWRRRSVTPRQRSPRATTLTSSASRSHPGLRLPMP